MHGKQKQNGRIKLAFRQCFWIGNPDQTRRCCIRKYKAGYEMLPESFQRLEKTHFQGHVLGNHRFHQSKQTRPPSRSWQTLAGVSSDSLTETSSAIQQSTSTTIQENVFVQRHPVFTTVLHTLYNVRLILRQLLFQLWIGRSMDRSL